MTFVFGLDLIMMAILSYCHGLEFSDYSDFLRLHVSLSVFIPDPRHQFWQSLTRILTRNFHFNWPWCLRQVRGVDMRNDCVHTFWNDFAKSNIHSRCQLTDGWWTSAELWLLICEWSQLDNFLFMVMAFPWIFIYPKVTEDCSTQLRSTRA